MMQYLRISLGDLSRDQAILDYAMGQGWTPRQSQRIERSQVVAATDTAAQQALLEQAQAHGWQWLGVFRTGSPDQVACRWVEIYPITAEEWAIGKLTAHLAEAAAEGRAIQTRDASLSEMRALGATIEIVSGV